MQNYFFDKEITLLSSKTSVLVLTNFRIRYQKFTDGALNVESIFLNKISSVKVHNKNYPWLLIMSLAILGLTLSSSNPEASQTSQTSFILGMLLGFTLFFSFLGFRKYLLTIHSDTGIAIDIPIKGIKKEMVLKFVNQIEEAMYNYDKL